MPHYAHLKVDLRCPNCNQVVSDLMWLQWGFCPGRGVREDTLYHLGDSIRWHTCADLSTPSWVYFVDGDASRGANIGDVDINNLFVQDAAQFFWQTPEERRRCDNCGMRVEGAVLEIRDSILTRAWIYQPGEFDHTVDIVIIGPDGALKPMPEWNDHQMATITLPCGDPRMPHYRP